MATEFSDKVEEMGIQKTRSKGSQINTMPNCTSVSKHQGDAHDLQPPAFEETRPGKRLLSILTIVAVRGGCGVVLLAFTISTVLISYDQLIHALSPHMGVVAYLVSPVVLGTGMFLIVMGWLLRLLTHSGREGLNQKRVTIDFENKRHTRNLSFAGLLIIILIAFLSLGGYHSYHFTESTEFCGIVCHEVMNPHYVTHKNSPHAEVGCVECHVGDGAEWYFRTKLNGLREVHDYLNRSYELPIKSPLMNMRPARETCEECHWPEKFTGNQEKTLTYFSTDKENSPYSIRLLLKVGGGNHGSAKGIHWHVTGGNKVEYIPMDDSRQKIPWVRVTDRKGKVTEYRSHEGSTEAITQSTKIRTMDCVDCHNRPSHVFQDPDYSINQALLTRMIDPLLPGIKEVSLSLLQATYESTPVALSTIERGIRESYSISAQPVLDASREQSLKTVIETLQRIYTEGFFPEAHVDWTTHPDFIGHFRWEGCFRCHDGMHSSSDGRVISNDCNACHLIVGQGEGHASPSELPYQIQEFLHPPDQAPLEGETRCSECHGAPPANDYSVHKGEEKVIASANRGN